MPKPYFLLVLALVMVRMEAIAQAKGPAKPILECPNIMAHTVDRRKHPGWQIYSNMPVRLTGADIQYLVHHHYEAVLEPDQISDLSDENSSTAEIFQLMKHRDVGDLLLVCHYGVHAGLAKDIPASARECTIVHHKSFDETMEGEFKVFCQ